MAWEKGREMIKCSECGTENAMSAEFCEACGNSFAAIQEQLGEAYRDEADRLKRETRAASKWLVAVAFLTGAAGFVEAIPLEGDAHIETVSGTIVATVLFLALALWARRSPVAASVSALVLLGFLWLVDAVLDPTTIYHGIILKVVLVIVLSRAIKAGLRFRELKREGRAG